MPSFNLSKQRWGLKSLLIIYSIVAISDQKNPYYMQAKKASISSVQAPRKRQWKGNTKPQQQRARDCSLGKTERKSFQWETTGVDYCDYTSKAKALP